jgi:hypothetical protein
VTTAVEPEIFQLVVRASPKSAQITIDGTVVDGNPFRALYPKGGEAHRITASADGYESKSEDISLASDITVDLDLKRSFAMFETRNIPTAARQPIAPTEPMPPMARRSIETGETGAADASSMASGF